MKKYLILFTLFFSISCKSVPIPENRIEILPTASFKGCKEFAKNRNEYVMCTNNLFKLWEARENSDIILTVIEDRRYNDEWKIKTYLHCRHDFCDKISVPERSPTVWKRVKNSSWFGGMGFVIGITIGVGL